MVPELVTDRYVLRAFTPDDADDVQRYVSVREVAGPTGAIPHPYPEGAAATWIADLAGRTAAGSVFTWAITDRASGRLLGAIELRVDADNRRGEFGYWLGQPFWGQGVMTEAARRVVAFAFATLDLHRVHATCVISNARSARVLEKAGLQREGVLREHVLRGGRFEDWAVYGLLRSEWAGPN